MYCANRKTPEQHTAQIQNDHLVDCYRALIEPQQANLDACDLRDSLPPYAPS